MKNIFSILKKFSKKNVLFESKGNCPKCSGNLIEKNGYYCCSNILLGSCTFKIPTHFKGSPIDLDVVAEIESYTAIHTAINEALKGNPKKRDIKKDDIKNDLENKESEKAILPLPCGNCGSKVIKDGDYAKCTNEKCGLKAESRFRGIDLDDFELSEMMAKGVTGIYFFKSKNDKKGFSARIALEFDSDLNLTSKYRLINNVDKLNEIELENYVFYYHPDYTKTTLRERIAEDTRKNIFY